MATTDQRPKNDQRTWTASKRKIIYTRANKFSNLRIEPYQPNALPLGQTGSQMMITMMTAFIERYSPLSSRLTALAFDSQIGLYQGEEEVIYASYYREIKTGQWFQKVDILSKHWQWGRSLLWISSTFCTCFLYSRPDVTVMVVLLTCLYSLM